MKSIEHLNKKAHFILKQNQIFFLFLLFASFGFISFTSFQACSKKEVVFSYNQLQPPDMISLEHLMLKQINRYRSKKRRKPLKENKFLFQIARAWSDEMVKYSFCAHVHPYDKKLTTIERLILFNRFRIYHHKTPIKLSFLAENVGYAASSSNNWYKREKTVWEGFLHSRKHRHNILTKEAEIMGVGISFGKNQGMDALYVTQLFGKLSSGAFLGAKRL